MPVYTASQLLSLPSGIERGRIGVFALAMSFLFRQHKSAAELIGGQYKVRLVPPQITSGTTSLSYCKVGGGRSGVRGKGIQ